MSDIKNNILELRKTVPPHVKIIAVSKTKPSSAIQEAYEAGQRAFGENYVQEIIEKQPQLPQDIEWHFIGHLQSNKVKNIAPFVSYIHAVHSVKLLQEIEKQAAKNERIIKCFLQFHIADEDTKHGFDTSAYKEELSGVNWSEFPHVEISGVMGMASFVENQKQIELEFEKLTHIFQELKSSIFKDNANFTEISMGMSGDWPLAVEKGSTMIRVGSSIFGSRL